MKKDIRNALDTLRLDLRDSGVFPATSFTPASIPGVLHWFEAAKGVTISNSRVTQWADQIGTNHLTTETAGKEPAFSFQAWGAPAIVFDQTQPTRLKFTNSIELIGKTLIWFSETSLTGARVLFSSGNSNRYIQYYGAGTDGQFYIDGIDTQIGKPVTPTASLDRAAFAGGYLVTTATTSRLSFNEALGNSTAHTAIAAPISFVGSISASTTGAYGGNIYGVVVVNRTDMTLAEIQSIYAYFANKYSKSVFTVGTGQDYSSLTNAFNAAPVKQRYKWAPANLIITKETFNEFALNKPLQVSLSGSGRLNGDTALVGYQLDSTDGNTIALNSPIDMRRPGTIRGMRINGKNIRYGIHVEPGGVAFGDNIYAVENCYIEHEGNPSPNNIWLATSQWAIGCGSADGSTHIVRNAYLKSANGGAYSIHDNVSYTSRNAIELSDVTVDSTSTYEHLRFSSLGSGIYDHKVNLTNIVSLDRPMPIAQGKEFQNLATPGLMYWRQNCYDIKIINCPTAYMLPDVSGQVISPTSSVVLSVEAGTANQTVTVSGTAIDILMKNATFPDMISVAGGGGLKAKVHGVLNVSEELVGYPSQVAGTHSIGKRLGDCSVSTKTLTVTVGATPVTFTFNQNYTAQSNATILAAINAVMGAHATVTAYNLNREVYRFWSSDRDQTITNGSAVGFEQYAAVYFDGSVWRLAKSTDPMIHGICLDRIVPGASGRILRRGYIRQEHVNYSGATVANGNNLVVDPGQDGRLIVSTGTVVATGVSTGLIKFNA